MQRAFFAHGYRLNGKRYAAGPLTLPIRPAGAVTPQVYEAVASATAADDMIAATLGVFSA
jgi:hypothetical protein